MNYLERFRVPAGAVVKLEDFEPKFSDEDESKAGSESKQASIRWL